MNKRLYSTEEIQEKISNVAKELPTADLDKLCKKDYSKSTFDISLPLLLRVPAHFTPTEKSEAVKDAKGIVRYTWDYEFDRDDFLYAVSTQWYARNDEYVQRWLHQFE